MSIEAIGTREFTAVEIAGILGLPRPTLAQQAVIEAPLEPSIVVAGAGSGKTETMANRVVWLLANRKVGVSEILGLTFTRKAAGELTERILRRVQSLAASPQVEFTFDPFDAPTIATYNSFASTIFRENALLIGREPESVVLSEASAWQLARKLVVNSTDDRLVELDKSVDQVTTAVIGLSRAISENVADPSAVLEMSEDFLRLQELSIGNPRKRDMYARVRESVAIARALPPILELAEHFRLAKLRRGFVEYSDQVSLALAIAVRVPSVVRDLRSRFRVVLLDEYQDTSVVQTDLLSRLFHRHPVMAVGDPHQSIYGWRGASAANLARFSRDFTGADTSAEHYALSTSWRNPLTVLNAANTIVRPLVEASPIKVEALEPRPSAEAGTLDVVFEQTIRDEADGIARWFAHQLEQRAPDGSRRSAAMLCRSVKKIDILIAALREHGVSYHVLGLGGLLDQPVIADLVSALRVMHDPTAGSELIRLLVGARWMIAPRDIKALHRLASWLSARDHRYRPLPEDTLRRLRESVSVDEGASLVDALDFLVDAPSDHSALSNFSEEGLERMRSAGREFAYLRSRSGLDLLDLSTLVQQVLLLDIEVAANENAQLGQSSLDAFDEQIASYLGSDESATLGSFLSWLAEAERRDNLAPRSEEPEKGVVQIMTIHGSKGLERDIVAIPRMVDGELPGTPRSKRGWLEFGALPYEFRGDSAELPVLDWRAVGTQKEFDDAVGEFEESVRARYDDEQRRLAYVAITRAKTNLLLSGSYWSTQKKPRGPGAFLLELQAAGVISDDCLPECDDIDTNPLELGNTREEWPTDPLGPRRSNVLKAAEAVRVAEPIDSSGVLAQEIELLLAERDRRAGAIAGVDVPTRIPASRFKDYIHDPARVASQLRRPMPERPFRQTRLGTLFHSWVERRAGAIGASDFIDATVAELDGDLDEPLEEQADLDRLQANFEHSHWAGKQPLEVETEIHVPLAGHVIVCKLDAVYASDDERFDYQIVDWKTGATPRDDSDLEARQLQLALYRHAFSTWHGIDPERVDAVFYFVAADKIVRPDRLYSESELVSLWSSVTGFIPPE